MLPVVIPHKWDVNWKKMHEVIQGIPSGNRAVIGVYFMSKRETKVVLWFSEQ